MLDGLAELNRKHAEQYGDPEIQTRIRQYEMAFRMQTCVPDLMDLSKEPASTFEIYGRNRGSRAPSRRTACSRAGSPSAASASFSSIIAAGTSTTICRAISRCSAATPISRPRR